MGRFWFSGRAILHSRGSRPAPDRDGVLVADVLHRAGVVVDDGRGTAKPARRAGNACGHKDARR
ncbi:hypothetical protein VC218_07030 [Xanthomonas nasturtii]|nr:hypothetical protein [Xanthomonas nasturtii]MEA9578675.1 hypothetical protein [Xanthomonas nasturtii]